MDTQMRNWQASGELGRLSGGSVLAEGVFRHSDALAVRRFAGAFGARAGFAPGRIADFVLAVNEAAACACGRAPCNARVRLWVTGRRAYCQVHGDGVLLRRLRGTESRGAKSPGTGARTGGPDDPKGPGEVEELRRLLLRRLSDYLSVSSGPRGVTVLLSMTVSGLDGQRA
jgi:hypothetical protein